MLALYGSMAAAVQRCNTSALHEKSLLARIAIRAYTRRPSGVDAPTERLYGDVRVSLNAHWAEDVAFG
jgi:hypothetical protein